MFGHGYAARIAPVHLAIPSSQLLGSEIPPRCLWRIALGQVPISHFFTGRLNNLRLWLTKIKLSRTQSYKSGAQGNANYDTLRH
ncbi:hypothetical protein BDS110ZK17_83720 [Bradyrhizobium diazoefficiens]